MKIVITILALLIATNLLLAKGNNWELTLANGDIISNISIQNLVGDSLALSQSGKISWINVDSIIVIRKIVESKFWIGAGIGALAGTGLGALIASSSNEKSPSNSFSIRLSQGAAVAIGAVLGGVCGLLIGGIIGATASEDEVYDLAGKTLKEKLGIIRLQVVPKE